MKVVSKNNQKMFGDLAVGEVFTRKSYDEYLMKTSQEAYTNCVNLCNGFCYDLLDGCPIVPLKAKLVVYE